MTTYGSYGSASQAEHEVIILTDTLTGSGSTATPTVGASNNWIALHAENVDEGMSNLSMTKYIAGRNSYNPKTAKHQGDMGFTGRVIKRSSAIIMDVNKIKAILELWVNIGASTIYVFHTDNSDGTVRYAGYPSSSSVVLDSSKDTYGLNSYLKATINKYKFHHKGNGDWTVDINLDECNT